MKRLLARGMERIFQITPVFRKDERGAFHLPEFTMLEWYRTDCDYTVLMEDCESLLNHAALAAGHVTGLPLPGAGTLDISSPFQRITVEDAFETYAGWTPGPDPDPDRFNIDMVEKVEPALPRDRPVFLMDYPASMASLSRLKPGNPAVAERVELYAGGMELANGFSELNDPQEQRARFMEDMKRREEAGLQPYPVPEEFLQDLSDMPPAAGMALGIDRLVMLLVGISDIRKVVAFSIYQDMS
jgi:lysyl-tRNA synthetase class 2